MFEKKSLFLPHPRSFEENGRAHTVKIAYFVHIKTDGIIMDDDILDTYDPEIAKFVEVLLKNGNVGVFGGAIRVVEPKTG